ncbi:hypothetical protein HQ865_03240 [Mucilaginibacter mali]|uniref:Uncharacterized protein n=1 Tax=Mucilaginibacter mali TaxID=2740462 RepID=A0A7D4TKL5_9SPHI|nr:hypothetical protein [Mucilaginibacter mali]QKJ28813.1 hypothetical protein HQ865_03240 [Mucilaginibacter mali]
MKSDMDNREWLDDYLSLKQVNPNNPFTVPDGYFEELTRRASSRAFIDGVNDKAGEGFTIPEDYFNTLESNLQSRIAIEAALDNTAPGFTVPDNYFNEMQANLQSRINIEEALHHTTGDFTVPDDFFEDQHQQIISMVAVNEILDRESEGFTVPESYFANLENAILSKTTEADNAAPAQPAIKRQQPGIVRRMFTSGAFKYATAACLVLGIGGTIFLNRYESPNARHERSYIHKALSQVSDADIMDYLQTHMDAADTRSLMNGADQINTADASVDELKDYLSTH